MTSIVGVLCSDGAVVGADSSATFATGNQPTIEQPTQKLHVIRDRIIVAGTGQVGLYQRFQAAVESAWDGKCFDNTAVEVGKALSTRTVQDFASTNAPLKGEFGALVAFPCRKVPQLCEIAVKDLQPELKTTTSSAWYCSMGSAQPITDPFLGLIREVFWGAGPPTLQEGIFAVTWTLQQAVDLNPGGVKDPIRIAVLENDGHELKARLLDQAELDVHRQSVQAAKLHLGEYATKLRPGVDSPDVPKA